MSIVIALNSTAIETLDLTPATSQIEPILTENAIADRLGSVQFDIDYSREPGDPRELSEIPEVRLWFVRLDAVYPYMPILLDWKAGELARYAAMLVPHEFHRTEGIQYNPEALEIFLMGKIFTLLPWLDDRGISSTSKLQAMAQMFGYELDAQLFDRLRSSYMKSG